MTWLWLYTEVGLCLFLLFLVAERSQNRPPAKLAAVDWWIYVGVGVLWPIAMVFYSVASLCWLLRWLQEKALCGFDRTFSAAGGRIHAVLTRELGPGKSRREA